MTFLGIPLVKDNLTLASTLDESVNFVEAINGGKMEALEARFVRREEGYIVAYISSQTACEQACRFCHLTASGQVKGRDASVDEMIAQGEKILSFFAEEVKYGRQKPSPVVHFNFMARGEPLASKVIQQEGHVLMEELYKLAKAYKMTPIVKISTIGSEEIDSILDVFPYEQPDIYYSLYSTNEAFRKKWLPKAPAPQAFLEKLEAWQKVTHKLPTIHHAIIAQENSSFENTQDIISLINQYKLRVNLNIVRYNPPTPKHGEEPTQFILDEHVKLYQKAWPQARCKVVKKVGYDVAASCGMFVGGRQPKGAI